MSSLRPLALAIALVAVLTQAAIAAGPPTSEELSAMPPAPGERALVGRLMAPCCRSQTLDTHASEPARALKMEIRARLYAGEAAEAVEQSVVERYGDWIRATPPRDPMRMVAAGLAALVLAAGAGVAMVLRRWRRAGAGAEPLEPRLATARDAYDDRIDAELDAMD